MAIECVHLARGKKRSVMAMTLEKQIRLLSVVDIFVPLSDEEMEELAKQLPDTFLEEGDVLYSPKEGTERLFVLKEGRVQLYEIDESGTEITLSVIEDGNIFGEMALTGQSLEGVYVRAVSPSTVASLRRKDLPARLASLILRLVDSEGVVSSDGYRIRTHYTHEQLGTMIGCKRVAVTRAFRKLEEGGAVELRDRRIVVKDMDALKELAEAS